MAELVYVDEQKAQAGQVLRCAVASGEFTQEQVRAIAPEGTLEATIQQITELHCKVLITDYRLSDHKPDVGFNGADLVRAFRDKVRRLPVLCHDVVSGSSCRREVRHQHGFPQIRFPES